MRIEVNRGGNKEDLKFLSSKNGLKSWKITCFENGLKFLSSKNGLQRWSNQSEIIFENLVEISQSEISGRNFWQKFLSSKLR